MDSNTQETNTQINYVVCEIVIRTIGENKLGQVDKE